MTIDTKTPKMSDTLTKNGQKHLKCRIFYAK
nr:MAG TPA: hypothetical protein [Caudoviricetes sp.]